MSNLKLISVRIDPEAFDAIEKLAIKHPYFNRNSIINQLLKTLLRCAGDDTIWKMLSVFFPYDKGYVIKFEKESEVLRQRSQDAKSEDI